jgi:hypothetical protein
MALIVEDGTNVPDAESYVDVATADAYLAARGMDSDWLAKTDTEKEALLRRAMDYMRAAYRGRWKGWRAREPQALDWPRQGVVLHDLPYNGNVRFDTIPREVQQAQIELAVRQLATTGPLMTDLSRATVSESVGSVAVTYDVHSPQQVRYAQVDALLGPYLASTGIMVQVGRV